MASKKKQTTKAAGASKTNDTKLAALHARVGKLEKHLKTASRLGLLADAVPSSGGVVLSFSLQPGGPSIVRLTLDNIERIVLGSSPVDAAPRASGSLVSVLIELWGTGGQQAVIGVKNAQPSVISSTIPQGRSDWSEPRTLKVS
jgi:hypothetical protein